jgi:hypothetical protein
MGAEAKKYFTYAMECARQAGEATSDERRGKLLELSRVWMMAAMTEGRAAVDDARQERSSRSRARPVHLPAR